MAKRIIWTEEELKSMAEWDAKIDAAPMTEADYKLTDFVDELLFPHIAKKVEKRAVKTKRITENRIADGRQGYFVAKAKKYREENKEQIKKRRAEYYQKNKERIDAHQRAYRERKRQEKLAAKQAVA